MIRKTLLLVLLLSGWSGLAQAVDDAQFDAIRQLGQLNGVALQCGFLDQTRQMKQGLVKALPRRRELGFAFDEETNRAFLQFIEKKSSCPSPADFSAQVERALQRLEQVFAQHG